MKFFDRKMLAGILLMILLNVGMEALQPLETLDAKFFYNGAEAYALFQSYTLDESARYFRRELVDLCFALAYTYIFYLALSRRVPSATWLAFPTGLFDFVETLTVIYCLRVEPVGLTWLGWAGLRDRA